MTVPKRYIRILLFSKKKKDITLQEYYDHWSKVHAPLVSPLLKRIGVISYTQVHITPEIKDAVTPFGPAATVGQSFDGYASFLIPSMEDFLNGFQDQEYLDKIKPDEDNFMDREPTLMVFGGYETAYIEGGEITKLGQGK